MLAVVDFVGFSVSANSEQRPPEISGGRCVVQNFKFWI